MPRPLSAIDTHSASSPSASVISMRPPGWQNLIALPTRFQMTWRMRPTSAWIGRMATTGGHTSSTPRLAAGSRMSSSALRTSSPGSHHSRVSCSLSMLMLDMSRMSAISRACALPLRSMALSARNVVSAPPCCSSTWVQPMMALSGVRSSCDSTAIRSSLSRLTRSASWRAACSRSSSASRAWWISTRSETSVAIAMLRPSSTKGDTLHCTCTRAPAASMSGNSACQFAAAAEARPSIQSGATKSVTRLPTTPCRSRRSNCSNAGLASTMRLSASSRQIPPGAFAYSVRNLSSSSAYSATTPRLVSSSSWRNAASSAACSETVAARSSGGRSVAELTCALPRSRARR